MKNRTRTLRVVLAVALCAALATVAAAAAEWKKLFDGKSMAGWRVMAVHGGSGGVWTVENGALVGDQDKEHKGGLVATERKYGDLEIEFEFQADYPADTGLFLRTREDGMGYQVTIDYRDGGFVGSLYAPAEGGYLIQYPDWQKAYKKTGWNQLRVQITGQPARITAWLNGTKTLDYQDTRERYPREGYVGFQVHGGKGSWGDTSRARFRNVRYRELP